MAKDKNVMMDIAPLTSIDAITSDVGSCELKEEIYEDSSTYADKVIGISGVIINLGNSKDKDELIVKDIYPLQLKTIKLKYSLSF